MTIGVTTREQRPMTTRADQPDDAPNTASLGFIEGLQALEGEEMPGDQDAVLDTDEVEHERQPSRTEFDHLDPDLSAVSDPDDEGDVLLTSVLAPSGLRDGETDDAGAAAQEGLTWVPPIDPPVIPDLDDQAIDPRVAAGTGISATDESYATSGTLLPDEDELRERVREALRADAETSRLAETLVIGVVGSTAVIRGVVDDIDDSDAIAAVAERVPGIEEVRDETEVPGL
jgi:hypothetical protein